MDCLDRPSTSVSIATCGSLPGDGEHLVHALDGVDRLVSRRGTFRRSDYLRREIPGEIVELELDKERAKPRDVGRLYAQAVEVQSNRKIVADGD